MKNNINLNEVWFHKNYIVENQNSNVEEIVFLFTERGGFFWALNVKYKNQEEFKRIRGMKEAEKFLDSLGVEGSLYVPYRIKGAILIDRLSKKLKDIKISIDEVPI